MADLRAFNSVEVAVTRVAASHARYEWDPHAGVIRLMMVAAMDDAEYADAPFDRGQVVIGRKTIPAFVVRRVPTFPGCYLTGRAIGLHEQGGGKNLVVVPVADPAFGRVASIRDLPDVVRVSLEEALPFGIWHEADAAHHWYQQIVIDERTARAQRRRSGGLAWRAGVAPPRDEMAGEAARHSPAEYHLRDVPARFQDYVVELLLPQERILALVHRPPAAPRRGLFRHEALPEALLVVTDRQLLAMADTLPPDATMARWGFRAESAAVERLLGVTVAAGKRLPALVATFMATTGSRAIDFALPNGQAELQGAAAILCRFRPRDTSRALQRRYDLHVKRDDWGTLAQHWRTDPYAWERFAALRAQVLHGLPREESVLHWAVDPAWGHDRGALLLALTPSHLLWVEEGAPVEHLPIGVIASATLQHAPTGSWFGVMIPTGTAVRERRFHCYAVSYAAFAKLFTLLRQSLGNAVSPSIAGVAREAADG